MGEVELQPSPRFRRREVAGGGVRKTAASWDLVVELLEWGTGRLVPIDPPDGLKLLDVRVGRGTIELLVQSPSFAGGEGATWETAEWWIPAFRRVTEGGSTL